MASRASNPFAICGLLNLPNGIFFVSMRGGGWMMVWYGGGGYVPISMLCIALLNMVLYLTLWIYVGVYGV